jgi:hypothetical protein
VLLVARPGSGGSAAGLLAGLATPGRTLWVRRPWGPQAGAAPEVPLPAPRVVEVAGDRPPPIARPPGPEDLDAMLAETAEPEFVFATPSSAAAPPDLGLVVVDRADELDELEAARVAAVRGEVPLLVVVPRADAGQRAALAERFALRSPVRAGGGWDPAGTRLEVTSTGSPLSRRRRIGALVRAGGPGLVVVPSRERADRTAAGLADDGLRAAVWAPPPLRASRAAAAVGAWRSRRLDALVVPVGTPPPLGRARLGLLLDASDGTPEQWRDRLAELDPARSVLLVGPDAPDASQALAAEPGCLRAALLEPYGEPVEQPCGRCATCSPQPSA